MRLLPAVCLIAITAGPPAHAADPCAGFKWDIGRERALFAGVGDAQTAGTTVAVLPALGVDHLYRLTLAPQGRVSFVVPPDKNPDSGSYGGLASLRVTPGYYRFSVSAPLWIDVIADGQLAAVTDFQGQHDCEAPRKIVEFDLTHGRQFVLQVSGGPQSIVLLTITRAAAP